MRPLRVGILAILLGVVDLVLSRNRFPLDSGPEKFRIPRGESHFATLEGNIGLRISE